MRKRKKKNKKKQQNHHNDLIKWMASITVETFSTADSLNASQSELQDRSLRPTQNVGAPSQDRQYVFDWGSTELNIHVFFLSNVDFV